MFSIFSSDFFLQNLWWIIVLAVLTLVLIYYLIDKAIQSHKKTTPKEKVDGDKYLEALGGKDNIITHELVGSRIILTLHSYSKINKALLEGAGVTGFIEKSDKLTLVVKDGADEVYRTIFGADY
jgi:phosphotransferase system IIB component